MCGQAFPRHVKNVTWVVLTPESEATTLHQTTLASGSAPTAGAGRGEETLLQTTCFSLSPFSFQTITRFGNYCLCTEIFSICAGTPASVPHPLFPYIRAGMCAHLYQRKFSIYLPFISVILGGGKLSFGGERGSLVQKEVLRLVCGRRRGKRQKGGAHVNFIVCY